MLGTDPDALAAWEESAPETLHDERLETDDGYARLIDDVLRDDV